ncbi:splicing factor, proline- and glutamine-rich-like [Zea mays]|uniref:splicing factor, proline- and glutamine-rich-like n=1 Tax=Zea mays TaxID=4577 RepID=UPI001652A9AA|nr:splicing factor, proline- and glutamine-rich-like [Zea mays]
MAKWAARSGFREACAAAAPLQEPPPGLSPPPPGQGSLEPPPPPPDRGSPEAPSPGAARAAARTSPPPGLPAAAARPGLARAAAARPGIASAAAARGCHSRRADDGGSKVEEFCEGHDEGFFFFRKKQSTRVSVPRYRDVNETREEEARGEDAADYDAADADYEQEDDAGGGAGDGWSSGGGQFEGGGSAGGWDSWPSSDAGASSGGGSSRAWKSRKTHWVPPPKVPAREEDKILIVPCGDESWIDASFQGQGRRTQVNKVLGSICKYLWPGVVMEKGVEVPCMSWDQYGLAFNAEHRNAQGAVWHEFWKRYKLSEDGSHF